MGKNFKKNFQKKSTDLKKVQGKGNGSVSKPTQNQNKGGGNRYFSKQLQNMKSPGPNNMQKSPNSANKNGGKQVFNKMSPKQKFSPGNKGQMNNKNIQQKKSPAKAKQENKKKEDSDGSESFDQDDDSDYDEEEIKKMVQSKLFKFKDGEEDSDDDVDLDEADFDDLEESEDDDDDEQDSSPNKASIKPAGNKRKLDQSDDSEEIDSEDEDQLKAMLEESSDEADLPPAKKTKADDTKSPKKITPAKTVNNMKQAPDNKKNGAPKTQVSAAGAQMKTLQSKPVAKENAPVEPSKKLTKSQKKKLQKQQAAAKTAKVATSESVPEPGPCTDEITLPTGKASLGLKLAQKGNIVKLVQERMNIVKNKTLFIKPVPQNCKQSMLKELAKEMIDCRIPRKNNFSRGFALLEFKTPQVAEKYKKMLNGKNFLGKTLIAMVSAKRENPKPITVDSINFTELYVSGLPKETTKADMKYIFPDSTGLDLPTLKDKTCMGFAKVKFALPETALKSFETRHLTSIRNRHISVNFCLQKDTSDKKSVSKSPTKAAGKKQKQPAIKLAEIASVKPSVKVEEVKDDSDDESQSETEAVLANVKSQKQKNATSNALDILSALKDMEAEESDDEDESDEEEESDDDEEEESDDEEGDSSDEDDDDDIKSPPAKRKPAVSK